MLREAPYEGTNTKQTAKSTPTHTNTVPNTHRLLRTYEHCYINILKHTNTQTQTHAYPNAQRDAHTRAYKGKCRQTQMNRWPTIMKL